MENKFAQNDPAGIGVIWNGSAKNSLWNEESNIIRLDLVGLGIKCKCDCVDEGGAFDEGMKDQRSFGTCWTNMEKEIRVKFKKKNTPNHSKFLLFSQLCDVYVSRSHWYVDCRQNKNTRTSFVWEWKKKIEAKYREIFCFFHGTLSNSNPSHQPTFFSLRCMKYVRSCLCECVCAQSQICWINALRCILEDSQNKNPTGTMDGREDEKKSRRAQKSAGAKIVGNKNCRERKSPGTKNVGVKVAGHKNRQNRIKLVLGVIELVCNSG